MISRLHRVPVHLLTCLLLVGAWTGCSGPGGEGTTSGGSHDDDSQRVAAAAGPIVVYCGRSESLVEPLLEQFRQATGLDVEVRYGGTAELAATLLEEDDRTPADLFFSQDAAALGALAADGRFRPLAAAALERVPARFRAVDGLWIGISGRARSVVYNPELIGPGELPQSMAEVVDQRYRGKFGVAPTNASFQAHLAVMQTVEGSESLSSWLAGLRANQPQLYPKNSPIVEAVLAGEIEWGLVNHYYLWRALAEDPDAPGKNFFMPDGDASSFVNLAGVGVLSDHPRVAELVEFLVSDAAQTYFAEQTFEYPLVPTVAPSVELPLLARVETPDVDYAVVSANLEPTLAALGESGLLQ